MEVRVLGPIEATVNGRAVQFGAVKQRAVLAMLALRVNSTWSADELIEGLWGEHPPPTAPKMLQQHISQLRRLLGDGNERASEIVTHGRGYELRLAPEAIDVGRVERLLADGPLAKRCRFGVARRCRTWPTNRSRPPRSGGSTSCGWPLRRRRSTRSWPTAATER